MVTHQIEHLHCHYRVIGSNTTQTMPIVAQLDALARERVADFFEQALKTALGHDPTVYIIREVLARPLLFQAGEAVLNPTQTARRWGERLAEAVVRAIIRDKGDGVNLVRFADQPDYVVHFISALLDGTAWKHWYYAGCAALRPPGLIGESLALILLDNREFLPVILASLQQIGRLEALLAALSEPTLDLLWSRPDSPKADPGDSLRPIFGQALRLLSYLEVWPASAQISEDELFEAYLATDPALADWRDTKALAQALLEIVGFLSKRGYLKPAPSGLSARLELALSGAFDWLGVKVEDWLRPALLVLLETRSVAVRPELPSRPTRQNLSTRQRELLDDLAIVLKHKSWKLESTRPTSPANALRLYAALVAQDGRWADDPAVFYLINTLLQAYAGLLYSGRVKEILEKLGQGELETALEALPLAEGAKTLLSAEGEIALSGLPEAEQESARRSLRFIANLGKPGLDLLAKLSKEENEPKLSWLAGLDKEENKPKPGLMTDLNKEENKPESALLVGLGKEENKPKSGWLADLSKSVATSNILQTNCPGIFLLLRGLLDLRLPDLSLKLVYPGSFASSSLLVALGLRLVGEAGLSQDGLDQGLSLWAGFDGPTSLEELGRIWSASRSEDHARFQAALLGRLAAQRILQGGALHLYKLNTLDGTALVAGDETARLWPLAGLVTERVEADQILGQWLKSWEDVTGYRPSIITADQELSARLADFDLTLVSTQGEDELAVTHREGYRALQASLTVLEAGQLGLVETDLSLGLTATALLRVWARWLRRFADSSVPYLLDKFIRRPPGQIYLSDQSVTVEMERLPMDMILEMAGYTADLEQVVWLDQRRVRFRLQM